MDASFDFDRFFFHRLTLFMTWSPTASDIPETHEQDAARKSNEARHRRASAKFRQQELPPGGVVTRIPHNQFIAHTHFTHFCCRKLTAAIDTSFPAMGFKIITELSSTEDSPCLVRNKTADRYAKLSFLAGKAINTRNFFPMPESLPPGQASNAAYSFVVGGLNSTGADQWPQRPVVSFIRARAR